jgi:hypothetical protein
MSMRRLVGGLLILFAAGCGSKDPNKVLASGEVSVPPGKGSFNQLNIATNCSFTLTFSAKGGEIDGWVEPGAQVMPIVVYDPKTPLPKAKVCADGQEETSTGTLGWGSAQLMLFNRGTVPVQVRYKLTIVPTP